MRCRVTRNPGDAADALVRGDVVALPTETVYGLGGNALDPSAVAQIFAAKERPEFDPLMAEFPEPARRLAEKFWPGPLTLILPKREIVPDLVTSGLPTVGVRWPAHPLMQQVIQMTNLPIAAPSANRFGKLSPTTAEHVLHQLGDRIHLVLDGGPCSVGVESTIVYANEQQTVILRPGGISQEAIEAVSGPLICQTAEVQTLSIAPGQLPSHYAPRTPLRLLKSIPEAAPHSGTGVLLFEPQKLTGYDRIEVLSISGDLIEAAANLFAALHRLDDSGIQVILAQQLKDYGLGRAINDRLARAAFNSSAYQIE